MKNIICQQFVSTKQWEPSTLLTKSKTKHEQRTNLYLLHILSLYSILAHHK